MSHLGGASGRVEEQLAQRSSQQNTNSRNNINHRNMSRDSGDQRRRRNPNSDTLQVYQRYTNHPTRTYSGNSFNSNQRNGNGSNSNQRSNSNRGNRTMNSGNNSHHNVNLNRNSVNRNHNTENHSSSNHTPDCQSDTNHVEQKSPLNHSLRQRCDLPINQQNERKQNCNPDLLMKALRADNIQSLETRQLRKSILHVYKCPFREEGSCRNENTPGLCMFSHAETTRDSNSETSTGDETQFTLRSVPSWLCIYNLLGSCKSKAKKLITDDNQVTRCKNGIHVDLEQMMDLETLESEHSHVIQNFFGEDGERECSVCFDRVLAKCIPRNRRFGILENCTHVFCAPCLRTWRLRNKSCPVCRVQSNRFLIHKKWVENSDQKRKLFSNERPDQRLSSNGDYEEFDMFTSGLAFAMRQFLVDGFEDTFDVFDPLPLDQDLEAYEIEMEWW